MKLNQKQIDPFLKSPAPKARAVLIYGPDDGLMRARSKQLALTQVKDLNDPFNVSVLKGEDVSSDPARLADEANAISMMGDPRLVKIEQAGDGITPALKTYLENPSDQALVIIEAGDLPPRSNLRKAVEAAKNAASVPCYVADARGASAQIRTMLSDDGYTAAPDAIQWLAANLAGDHGRIVSEIEKLKTYMGDTRRIELSHVQAACGAGGAQSMDDFIFALAGRQKQPMLRAYTLLQEDGVPLISMLRALQTHFRRLHLTSARMKSGMPAKAAMDELHPKVFFKNEDAFIAHLNSWSMSGLSQTLVKLSDLEARVKQTGANENTLAAQAFLSIAASR